jgi:hypothetical protein
MFLCLIDDQSPVAFVGMFPLVNNKIANDSFISLTLNAINHGWNLIRKLKEGKYVSSIFAISSSRMKGK